MLRKLLKYEFRSTGRTYGLIYLVTVLLAVATGLLSHLESLSNIIDLIFNLTSAGFTIMVFVIFVVTVVLNLTRYGRGLYGDEGYLMHTLPVSPWQLIASKLITSIVWTVATLAVALVSLLVMILGSELFRPGFWEGVGRFFQALMQIHLSASDWNTIGLLAMFCLLWLLFLTGALLQIYLCIGLGHLTSRHHAAWSVLLYFGINVAMSWFQTFLADMSGNAAGLGTMVAGLGENSMLTYGLLARACLFEILWAAVYWAGTQLLLTKKLNLN